MSKPHLYGFQPLLAPGLVPAVYRIQCGMPCLARTRVWSAAASVRMRVPAWLVAGGSSRRCSDTEVVEGLGDQARSYSAVTKYPPAVNMPDFHRAGVVFMRGNTVVYIGLSEMKAEELVPFAKKIDLRLTE